YSKLLLRDLGWTEEEIDSLPQRVRDGEFTFEDLIATAQQAVDEGVVEEGYGFWHRTANGPDFLYYYYGMGGTIMNDDGQLVFDTEAARRVYELLDTMTDSGVTRRDLLGADTNTMWFPAVASAEEVLFAAGGTWNWPNMALNFVADRGGNDYLTENLGLMLIPAMETGSAITLTHPLAYLVSADSERPDVAMALIAAVTTPEANNRHAIDSFHLGILNAQLESEEYLANPQISGAHYMLDYTTALPNHPGYSSWSEAYYLGIQGIESDQLTPEEAVDTVVAQMQSEMGDSVVIQ
ncbi:MAG: extracellular solute-binding protein, partial [Burkholderiales bacterium]|nr:extracellular solute-binding protein [Anaerolineae bacterium]